MFTDPFKIDPPLIAHRGASALAPENTLAAFKKAKELGIQWVEFDVTLTRCGELVVIHDDTLQRTTNGKGSVTDFTYNELKQLDAGGWFHQSFSSEKIPTLKMVLDTLTQVELAANIELKEFDDPERFAKITLQLLKSYPKLPVVISSFSLKILQSIRKNSDEIPLGFLMHQWQSTWQSNCEELNCVSLNVNHRILNKNRVSELKSSGKLLTSYTINQFDRAQELFAWGVDAIFTDCPLSLVNRIVKF